MKHFSRLSSVPIYIDIALDNFKIAITAEHEITKIRNNSEFNQDEKDYYLLEQQRVSHKQSITTVVFISMAIEAYIYDYSARELSDNYPKTYLDKLDIISKWVIIPKLITGKDFPIERQGFQLLKNLFGYRNKLVHFKSTNITSDTLESIQEKSVDSFEMALKAVETLIELSNDLATIDKEEPIMFLFDLKECKKVIEYKNELV
ncbi:hypothetical protein MHI27_03415 [Paenibacillus sp. FSL H8-0261]|uniref:hypothetical protein n=1 Tax=Paenibacillus sp. FSL H8-0261 TaxID=2921381 RepID=UPI003249E42B